LFNECVSTVKLTGIHCDSFEFTSGWIGKDMGGHFCSLAEGVG